MRTDQQYQSSDDTGGEPTDGGLFDRISTRVRRALGRVRGMLTSATNRTETRQDTDTNSTETTLPATVDGASTDDRHPGGAARADREISLDEGAVDTGIDGGPEPMQGNGVRSSSQSGERLRLTGEAEGEFIESDVWEDLEQ